MKIYSFVCCLCVPALIRLLLRSAHQVFLVLKESYFLRNLSCFEIFTSLSSSVCRDSICGYYKYSLDINDMKTKSQEGISQHNLITRALLSNALKISIYWFQWMA